MTLTWLTKLRQQEIGDLSKQRRHYYLLYTSIFGIMVIFVYSFFLSTGKTLIWGVDGYSQHYNALVYYAQWMRGIIRTLISEHRLVFPEWSFSLGMGADVATTLHYYAIGDPLNLLSVFVPVKYISILYSGLIVLRLYLAGLFFSMFCFMRGQKYRMGVLVGALTYIFCSFTIFAGVRHPYFCNPMVYLPLLLMGVEQIIAKKKPWLMIFTVFISAISNFYFFYMLVLMTVVYVTGRLIVLYRHTLRSLWMPLLRIFGASVLGIMLSAVLFLPVIATVLSDSRSAADYSFPMLYPWKYYNAFLGCYLSYGTPGQWTMMGFSVLTLPATILLWRKRHTNGLLKVLFVLGTLCLLIPFAGQLLNGMSYVSNRWEFGYCLIIAYMVTTMWPSLLHITKKDIGLLFGCTSVYAALCFILNGSRTIALFFALMLTMVVIFCMYYFSNQTTGKSKPVLQKILLFATMFSVFSSAFWCYSPYGFNYAYQFKGFRALMSEFSNTQDEAIKKIAASEGHTDFYRYSGRGLPINSSLYHNTHSTQYYWSLSNGNVSDARKELNIRENMLHSYEGLDDRTVLNALASVRYYVIPGIDSLPLPYGYQKLLKYNISEGHTSELADNLSQELKQPMTDEQMTRLEKKYGKNYNIYENQYTLPLGYTYSHVISRKAYDLLSSVEKQEAILQAAVVEDKPAALSEVSPKLTSSQVAYETVCNSDEITQQGKSFVVTKPNASVTLHFSGLSKSETYLCLRNLSFKGTREYDLYNDNILIDPLNLYNQTEWKNMRGDWRDTVQRNARTWVEPSSLKIKVQAKSDKKKTNTKSFDYYTQNFSWYANRKNFDVNLGYLDNTYRSVTITFPEIGIYNFDNIAVVCQPMADYVPQVNALKEDVLENVQEKTNEITGTISLKQQKLLCLSIPYSKGWSAYVDGKQANLVQTNTMYLGLALDKGDHTIRLTYQTPYLHQGMLISAAGFGILLLLLCFFGVRKCIRKFKKTKSNCEVTVS